MDNTKDFIKKLLRETKSIPKNPLSPKQEENDLDKFEDNESMLLMNIFSFFSIILSMSLLYTIHITLTNVLWTIIIGAVTLLLTSFNEKHKRESIIEYFKWKLTPNRPRKHNNTKMLLTVFFSLSMALIGVFMFLYQKETNIGDKKIDLKNNIVEKYDSLYKINKDSINNLIENAEVYVKQKNKSIVDNIENIEKSIETLNENYESAPRWKREPSKHNREVSEKKEEVANLYANIVKRTDERKQKLEEELLDIKNTLESKKKTELAEYKSKSSKDDGKNEKLNYFLLIITVIVESVIIYAGYNYAKNFNKFKIELEEYKTYFKKHPLMKELMNTMKFLDRLYLNFSKGSTVPNKFLNQMRNEYELKTNIAEMTNLMKSLKIYVQDGKSKKIMIDKNAAVENLYEIFVPLLEKEINE